MLKAKTKRPITLKPINPNAGVEVAYRKALRQLLAEMQADLLIGLHGGEIAPKGFAQDRSVPEFLQRFFKRWSTNWRKRIDSVGTDMARMFAKGAMGNTEQAMMGALKKAGFAVRFDMTESAETAYQAVIGENVAQINSWANGYFDEIQQDVWEAVRAGHDLGTLSKALQERYGITRRRADFIARDQNAKAKATIEKTRRLELGITQAIWQHSHAGKKPRPSHVKADGQTFDIAKGMYLDGKWVQPAEEYNCRCTSRAIIQGFDS